VNVLVQQAPIAVPVSHYENFPVASWVGPPALRAAISAIYGFARGADDIADEGDDPPAVRLAGLDRYARMLDRIESSSDARVEPAGHHADDRFLRRDHPRNRTRQVIFQFPLASGPQRAPTRDTSLAAGPGCRRVRACLTVGPIQGEWLTAASMSTAAACRASRATRGSWSMRAERLAPS